MSEKLISVIIPAYNHEKYVQETIRSVIDQTYGNIELLIIDDGSEDGTYAKIREMEDECRARFARFFCATQENQGTCVTQNSLLSLASGEYIALIDSDDMYNPNALAELSRVLDEQGDVALVVGVNHIMDGESRLCYWDERRNNVYEKEQACWQSLSDYLLASRRLDVEHSRFGRYDELLIGNHIPNGYLIRRSIFEKAGGYTKEAPLEDYWLMLQIAKFARMVHIDAHTFYYRWHAANTIKQEEKMAVYWEKTLLHEYTCLQRCRRKGELEQFRKVYGTFVFRIPFIASAYKFKMKTERLLWLNIFGMEFLISRKKRRRNGI